MLYPLYSRDENLDALIKLNGERGELSFTGVIGEAHENADFLSALC